MSEKILVVDDEPAILTAIQKRLSVEGYEVIAATGGKEAIIKARAGKPDLIILDILMPDMDGIAVSNTLKENPDTKDIPIIFLTALQTKKDEKKQGTGIGNSVVFAKPYDSNELIKQIKMTLGAK